VTFLPFPKNSGNWLSVVLRGHYREHKKPGAALLHPPSELGHTCDHAINGCRSLTPRTEAKTVKHPVFYALLVRVCCKNGRWHIAIFEKESDFLVLCDACQKYGINYDECRDAAFDQSVDFGKFWKEKLTEAVTLAAAA
jgi:hypothetical protein